MAKMVSINNERLRFAREFYDLSRPEVEESTHIAVSRLKTYEDGLDHPSYTELSKLASLYNQPLLYFFFRDKPKEQQHLVVAFRSAAKSGKLVNKKAKEMIEIANLYRLNLSELYEKRNTISFRETVEAEDVTNYNLNNWLRNKLELPLQKQINDFRQASELLEYVRNRFYDLGIYIFKDSFRDNSISGLCLYDDLFPIILLNNKTTFNRQLFTIFHEFYHLFLRETDVDFTGIGDEENQCNIFSSEFLMPTEDFNRQVSKKNHWENEDQIRELAERYCVSRDAVRYRLLKGKKISHEYYNKLREDDIRQMNSSGTGGNYYYTKISYLGRPYLKQVFTQYYRGQIPITKASTYTQMKAAHVSKLASSLMGGDF